MASPIAVTGLDSSSLIAAPRLDAAGAVALGRELLTAGDAEGRLPAPVAAANKALAEAHRTLAEAVRDRLKPVSAPSQLPPIDQRVDAGWGALYEWSAGWARLPGDRPESQEAAHLRSILFPDGVRFTQLPYKRQWSEGQARLERIDHDGLADVIAGLGGAAFVDEIRAAHKTYGEALGITVVLAPETERAAVRVREALDGFARVLRRYLLRVAAHGDDDDPAAAALAERLLAPLAEHRERARDRAAAGNTTQPAPSAGNPATDLAATGGDEQ